MKFSITNKTAFVLLLIICVWALPSRSSAIELSKRSASQKQWERLAADPVFNYKNEKELVKPAVPSSNIIARMLQGIISFFGSSIGKFICWTVLLLLLCYVAYRLFLNNASILFTKTGKIKQKPESIEDESLPETNWELELDQALTHGRNRDAIRFSYMLILHLLEQRQLIRYATDKTNYQYGRELESSNYKDEFKVVARQYEYTWYGNYPISNQSFNNYMTLFSAMKKKLTA